MSLGDLIFAQKGILLSIGLALLLLVIAGIIAVIPYVRSLRAMQIERKARAAAQAAERQRLQDELAREEQIDETEAVTAAPVETSGPNSIAPATAASELASSKPAPAAMEVSPSPSPAPYATAGGSVVAAAKVPASQSESENKDAPSSAMQDLLSSVFSDEEGEARRATLMKGLDHVDISHLLDVCNRVIGQLQHSGRASK